ncbi:hypothetical protein AB0E88_22080 [Streptomyces sp. NPDC028635]|uniref:hypothetical protein n=1 Tax=Streptomyces sp. NPDC028635 TaxID=3154800 RepID=UPI0033EB8450
MTRFGTTSLATATGTDPTGALGPTSTEHATITAPASRRPPLPSTSASPQWMPTPYGVLRVRG